MSDRSKMTRTKARKAVEAILACLDTEDIDGEDRVVLEDARAVLDQWLEDM